MDQTLVERFLGTRRAEAVFLAAACALAVAYRCHEVIATIFTGIPSTTHISYDGVYYAQIARNILAGAGPGWEAMTFPVLQPFLVAAASFVTGISNLAFLAVCLNHIAGVLVLIPAYLIARDCFGRKAAAATVLILIPYPHLVATSSGDTAEALYTLLIFSSVYLSLKAISSQDKRWIAAAGAVMGATYLARPEGLNLFLVVGVVAAYRFMKSGGPKHAAAGVGVMAAGFLLLALPYAAFLADSYGRIVLSPKLPYESVVMKAKVFGEPLKMSEVDGITPRGNLACQEKGGAGLVFGYFKDDPLKFTRKYAENLASELPWRVRNSSHMQGYPIVYPLYFWLPALAAFAVLVFKPDTRWKAFLIWAPFVNLFVYPVFTDGFWIYHAPYIPAIVILAAGTFSELSDRLTSKSGFAAPLLVAVVVVWAGYSSYVNFGSEPEKVDVISYRKLVSDESLKAGEAARRKLGTGGIYMMKWSRLVYYLGGRWVTLPVGEPDRVVGYGRSNGADYIVEEMVGSEVERGPGYLGRKDLELAFMYQSSETPYVVLVWKILDPGGLG